MRRLCFSITLFVSLLMLKHEPWALRADEPPLFHLGGRTIDELPPLTDEELSTPQQQALLSALSGDPYGHRGGDHACAGCAMLFRKRAIPSNTPHYDGYWVGGGLPVHGDAPTIEEGTFGWDYFGALFKRHVQLNWSHGRLYQGGTGAYKTDGPKLEH